MNSGGQIGSVANGLNPLKPCSGTETIVHLSGGDITKVTAGSGLAGGGDNGAVSLWLAGGYQLPQSCAAGKIPRWDGSAWQFADQQTYTNGAGLELTGNQFSVQSGYQLPQGCTSGQSAIANGNGTWKCEDSVGGLSAYTNWQGEDTGALFHTVTVGTYCNGSDIATGGGFDTDGADMEASGPEGSNGWFARGHGGLTGGNSGCT